MFYLLPRYSPCNHNYFITPQKVNRASALFLSTSGLFRTSPRNVNDCQSYKYSPLLPHSQAPFVFNSPFWSRLSISLFKSVSTRFTAFCYSTNSNRAYHYDDNDKTNKNHDRGPPSSETTQTDFGSLDLLGKSPVPSTSIDACLFDGFHLNSGIKITGGSGVLLVAGETFRWQPWISREYGDVKKLLNENGHWEVEDDAWGIFELIWPKPDLLILGLGKVMHPLSSKTKDKIHSLGIRVDIQDTRNAAAQFNLLATERGMSEVAAALIPIGWNEGIGVK